MKKLILISAFLFFSPSLWAGASTIGNGGHVVICDEKGERVLQLLDMFEASSLFKRKRNPAGFQSQTISEVLISGGEEKYILRAERRLARILSRQHPIFQAFKKALDLQKHVVLMFEQPLTVPQTNDTGQIWADMNHCHLQQMAVRSVQYGIETIAIDKNHYLELGPNNRTGLFLHEALHEYFGAQDSTLAVREVVWWLSNSIELREQHKNLILKVIETKQPVDPNLFLL